MPQTKRVLIALIVLCIPLVLVGGAAGAVVATVPLGTAAPFAVLASTAISGSPAAVINGDLGLPAGAGITGVTCADVHGSIYTSNGAGPSCPPKSKTNAGLVGGALISEGNALTNAQGRPGATAINPVLDNQNLGPGVYSFGAVAANLTGTLTLTGSASSVWILNASSSLITGVASTVQLAGGAQACHVFWSVGTQANIGGTFVGTVLSGTAIVMAVGSRVSGRLLAGSAVTLADARVTVPTCNTAAASGGGSTPTPSREIYCDPVTGQTYNLEVGQDKLPPYDKLNLVPATVDPVTGAKSCAAPAAAVTTTTATATATTPTTSTATSTTSTTTTSTPSKPAPKKQPAKKHATAGAHVTKVAKRPAPRPARHVAPKPAVHPFGITG
jgi:hypothetical protein